MTAPADKPNRRAASAERLRPHFQIADEAADRIAQDGSLSERELRSIGRRFQSKLLPLGPRRRRQKKKKIARALKDWRAGLRGVQLYRRHIPRWDKLGSDARKVRSRRLMSSISKRGRREEQARTKPENVVATNAPTVDPTTPLE
jgi:hypothetical protein